MGPVETPSSGRGTRHVRLKGVFLFDRDDLWGHAIRRAVACRGYGVRHERELAEALRRIHQRTYDAYLLSTSVGGLELESIVRTLMEKRPGARIILLVSPRVDEPVEVWRYLRRGTIIRLPRLVRDVAEEVHAILGEPWTETEITA